jgi:hypothetical protein
MNASRFRSSLVLTTLLGLAYLVYDFAVSRIDPVMALSGTVSIDGKPMTKGLVRFISLDPDLPVAYGSYVKDGRYEVPAEFGITPARYQVEFSSIGPNDLQQIIAANDAGEEPAIKEELPARFNRNTEVEIDLSSGSVLHADFDLR